MVPPFQCLAWQAKLKTVSIVDLSGKQNLARDCWALLCSNLLPMNKRTVVAGQKVFQRLCEGRNVLLDLRHWACPTLGEGWIEQCGVQCWNVQDKGPSCAPCRVSSAMQRDAVACTSPPLLTPLLSSLPAGRQNFNHMLNQKIRLVEAMISINANI